jgi:hypothetical protein
MAGLERLSMGEQALRHRLRRQFRSKPTTAAVTGGGSGFSVRTATGAWCGLASALQATRAGTAQHSQTPAAPEAPTARVLSDGMP